MHAFELEGKKSGGKILFLIAERTNSASNVQIRGYRRARMLLPAEGSPGKDMFFENIERT